jgi:putative transposase
VDHLIGVMGVSERFACRVTGQHPTTQRHQSVATTPVDPDAGLRQWLRDYAKAHPRWCHRRAYHDVSTADYATSASTFTTEKASP